jgi:hypothetical protein
MRVTRPGIVLVVVAAIAACGTPVRSFETAPHAVSTEPDGSAPPSTSPPAQWAVCFSGAAAGDPYRSGGNTELGTLCEQLPGLVHPREYPFFTWRDDTSKPLRSLLKVLDTDHDGRVTRADAPVELTLVGFSWGAFNARDLALAILEEPLFADDRKAVARLFLLDPFRTRALVVPESEIRIPGNVDRAWVWRHSIAPASDCSRGAPLGPYTGRPPVCTGRTQCHDFDFSMALEARFSGRRGSDIGHCTVPGVSSAALLELAAGHEPTSPMPPERPVLRD